MPCADPVQARTYKREWARKHRAARLHSCGCGCGKLTSFEYHVGHFPRTPEVLEKYRARRAPFTDAITGETLLLPLPEIMRRHMTVETHVKRSRRALPKRLVWLLETYVATKPGADDHEAHRILAKLKAALASGKTPVPTVKEFEADRELRGRVYASLAKMVNETRRPAAATNRLPQWLAVTWVRITRDQTPRLGSLVGRQKVGHPPTQVIPDEFRSWDGVAAFAAVIHQLVALGWTRAKIGKRFGWRLDSRNCRMASGFAELGVRLSRKRRFSGQWASAKRAARLYLEWQGLHEETLHEEIAL